MSADDNVKKERYLVTMALPYANADIHLGHLVEAVQTDIFVRYQKLRGNTAVFICADDTHGTPIEISALKQKITPEELIAAAHKNHVRDYAGFNIGFDIFYSTNSEENRTYAELIFANLQKNGLVVEREINQYFCEHDKRFLPDRFIMGACPKCNAPDQYGDVCESCGATYEPTDIREPRCIICSKAPVMKKSSHFYVQLAKCESFLREFIATPGVLQDDMKKFVMSWINEGLREWCVSRDAPYFGFKIPGTVDKYFYVWLDAPIGYISSTKKWCTDNGKRVEDYWSPQSGTKVVHFIGKDIVQFHLLFWPVMLKHSNFTLPTTVFVHGYLNTRGEKMSKSRGTSIYARTFLDTVKHPQAPEYLRFFYASKLSQTTVDLELTAAEFLNRTNTTLANNIGNLHHRTFIFCERYFDKKIPDAPWDAQFAEAVNQAAIEIASCYERSEYKQVIEKVHALGNMGNKYYQDSKPWDLIKTDPAAAATVMVTCANLVRAIMVFLKPVIPEVCGSLERQLGAKFSWNDYTFSLRDKPLVVTEKLVVPLVDEDISALFGPAQTPAAAAAAATDDGLIDIAAFKNVDLRIAKVLSAERVQKSKKLLKLQVEIGTERRQILAGIAEHYAPENLTGTLIVVIANLKTAKLMGLESQGMVLAASDAAGKLVLLRPDAALETGAKVS